MEKTKEYILRYQRQITLNGFGIEAQEKLSNGKVLVIGAGGLGCPVLQYLVAVGVGTIGIVDHDQIALSNLNRQILFGQGEVGLYKASIAAEKMEALNNFVTVTPYLQYCDQKFALEHFPNYDIIIDASDNFASRYLINDACVLLQKSLVFGAVSQFEGQVAVLNVLKDGQQLNYRDLFPEPPKNSEVLSCAEGGVLGVLPGIIGVMQATEAIKLIAGVGQVLANELLTYNALTQKIYTLQFAKNPERAKYAPESIDAFLNLNYQLTCS